MLASKISRAVRCCFATINYRPHLGVMSQRSRVLDQQSVLLLDLQQKYKQQTFRFSSFTRPIAECLSMHTNWPHVVENLPTIRDLLVISFCSPWPQCWVEQTEHPPCISVCYCRLKDGQPGNMFGLEEINIGLYQEINLLISYHSLL